MDSNKQAVISVIIPVYNAEKYLSRCLESVCNQTYQNLEIILIDDGSTDASGELCDCFATYDNRIHIIHKNNNGVSAARNNGLTFCAGDYISFVDADDFIVPEMVETLLQALTEFNADISACGFKQEMEPGKFEINWEKEGTTEINGIEQISCLLSNRFFTCSIWGKLYRKESIASIRFNTNYSYYEDYLFLYELMKGTQKTVFVSTPLYYYCNNVDSAARKPFNRKKLDIETVCRNVYCDIKQNYPALAAIAGKEYMRINLFCCAMLADKKNEYRIEIKRLRRNVKQLLPRYLLSDAALGYKLNAVFISLSMRLWNLYREVWKR